MIEMRKALVVAAILLVGALMSCADESIVHVDEMTTEKKRECYKAPKELKDATEADDKGQSVGPCVVSSDKMAECPLVSIAVHTTKHGPNDCPDGRRYYNSTGTYPDPE